MAGPALVERFIGRSTLTNGQSVFVDLPRDFIYAGLLLRISGTLTVAGGATNGTLHDENPMSFVRRIRVEGTGGGQSVLLKNLRGAHAYRRAHAFEGHESNAVPILSAAVQTAVAWSVVIPIWFAIPHRKAPIELRLLTALFPGEYSKVQLEVEAGDATDFINGGDRTTTVNAPLLDVYALQIVNPQVNAARWRYLEHQLGREQVSATATLRQFTTTFPTGRVYRDLMFRTTNEVTNTRQPVDTTLAAMQLLIGLTQVYRYQDFREYVERFKREYDVPQATNPSGLNALGSRDNPMVGYYFIDFMSGGRFEGMLDARNFAQRGLTVDPRFDIAESNTRQIDIVVGQLIAGPRVIAK